MKLPFGESMKPDETPEDFSHRVFREGLILFTMWLLGLGLLILGLTLCFSNLEHL